MENKLIWVLLDGWDCVIAYQIYEDEFEKYKEFLQVIADSKEARGMETCLIGISGDLQILHDSDVIYKTTLENEITSLRRHMSSKGWFVYDEQLRKHVYRKDENWEKVLYTEFRYPSNEKEE